MAEINGTRRRNDVNWSRFGLAENIQSSKQASNENKSDEQTRSQHVRELFDEEVTVYWKYFNIFVGIHRVLQVYLDIYELRSGILVFEFGFTAIILLAEVFKFTAGPVLDL